MQNPSETYKIWSTACTLLLVFPTGWRSTYLVLGVILMVAVVCTAVCVAWPRQPTTLASYIQGVA